LDSPFSREIYRYYNEDKLKWNLGYIVFVRIIYVVYNEKHNVISLGRRDQAAQP